MEIVNLILSALSQGMLYAPMAMGVFIAFKILNTPDLTIDGSLVFGMTVCAVVTIAGHPVLALVAGTAAGAVAGLITGLQQTKLQINAILAGILTMTGLYTVNYMVLGGQANLYLQHAELNESGSEVFVSSNTIYKMFASLFPSWDNTVAVLVLTALLVAAVAALLCVFFKTRPGMAIRATGDNEEMVRSSSINADMSRVLGIMIANALVALSGSLLCQQQWYADLNSGSGMLVVGLASVIIGQVLFGKRSVTLGVISAVAGSTVYRLILQFAYKINMPSYAVKLLSACIVALALSLPLLRRKWAVHKARTAARKEGSV